MANGGLFCCLDRVALDLKQIEADLCKKHRKSL